MSGWTNSYFIKSYKQVIGKKRNSLHCQLHRVLKPDPTTPGKDLIACHRDWKGQPLHPHNPTLP